MILCNVSSSATMWWINRSYLPRIALFFIGCGQSKLADNIATPNDIPSRISMLYSKINIVVHVIFCNSPNIIFFSHELVPLLTHCLTACRDCRKYQWMPCRRASLTVSYVKVDSIPGSVVMVLAHHLL